MSHAPQYAAFADAAREYELVPVYRRLICDSLTPVTAFHRLDGGLCSGLFESVVGGERVGRYTFIFCNPQLLIEARRDQVTVTRVAADGTQQVTTQTVADPIEFLRGEVQSRRAAEFAGLPPIVGGAVGYAGYDVVRYTERLPNAPPDDRDLPDLSFGFFDEVVVFDQVRKTVDVIALAKLRDAAGKSLDPAAAYVDACTRVDQLIVRLMRAGDDPQPADIDTAGDPQLEFQSNFTQPQFEDAVRKCVEYIRAGDIFQVVISQRLAVKTAVPPFEIYRTLRVVNPSPFMFYLRTPSVTLVGSSPEVMARCIDGRVTVRPLAGTRKRGRDDYEDRLLAEELLNDPKERAEHVMLVDLGRNDVGRIAEFGSVELSDVMVIERYSHVMHITSNVNGKLAAGKDAFDAMRSCLPAGTVSGAPKVRAMQIIDEIEPQRRGPYAGAVGYFDYRGNMDTCIALRTIVVKDDTAYVQAGAGIVADSDPTAEYHETLNKARGALKAIEITQRRWQAK